MDHVIWGFRALHIAGGAVALFTFLVPLLSKKGGSTHRRVGKVYVAAMFVAALSGIAMLPLRVLGDRVVDLARHVFLAYIGLFAFNAAFQGVRALRTKGRTGPVPFGAPHAVAALTLAAGVSAAVYGVVIGGELLIGFGLLGAYLAAHDLRFLLTPPAFAQAWYVRHMARMGVSCIATVTAFLVVNASHFLPRSLTIYAWTLPPVVGAALIAYWTRTYRARFDAKSRPAA